MFRYGRSFNVVTKVSGPGSFQYHRNASPPLFLGGVSKYHGMSSISKIYERHAIVAAYIE